MSDDIGMFEHADHAVPRRRARLLHRRRGPPADRRRAGSRTPDRVGARARPDRVPVPGRRRRARPVARGTGGRPDGRWHGRRGGRGLLGAQRVGVRHGRSPRARRSGCAQSAGRTSTTAPRSVRPTCGRWRSPRSAPPTCSPSIRATTGAAPLLADAVDDDRSSGRRTPGWPWPETAPGVRQRGDPRGADRRGPSPRPSGRARATGSTLLRWLLAARDASTATCRRRRSAAPGRDDHRPRSTSSRSRSRRWPTRAPAPRVVTGDAGWLDGLDLRDRLVRGRQRRGVGDVGLRDRRRLRRPDARPARTSTRAPSRRWRSSRRCNMRRSAGDRCLPGVSGLG